MYQTGKVRETYTINVRSIDCANIEDVAVALQRHSEDQITEAEFMHELSLIVENYNHFKANNPQEFE